MNTQLLVPTDDTYSLASEILKNGGLVAFPTETVYGLGANALDRNAVLSIFAAKGRPADNPLIVHIHSRDQLEPLCRIPDNAFPLMDAFWPGPLTILCHKKPAIPDEVTAGLPTVAVRMPSHPVARTMLQVCNLPVAAPSANSSGRPSPTTAAHVLEDMDGKIPLIIDGGMCDVGVESTVLDLCHGDPVVLRPGGVTREMISDVLHCEVNIAGSVLRPLREMNPLFHPACVTGIMLPGLLSLWFRARKIMLFLYSVSFARNRKHQGNVPVFFVSPNISPCFPTAIRMISVLLPLRLKQHTGCSIFFVSLTMREWKWFSVRLFLLKALAWLL